MAIKVKVGKKDENNIVDVSFETEPGRAKESYERTLKRLGSKLTIKGFRAGKAPAKVIEEHVGQEYVRAETLDNRFISELFDEVFKQENLNVVHITNIEKVDFEKADDPIKVTAKVELYPEVKLPDIEKIKLKVDVPDISLEEQVNETLEKLAQNFADFKELDADGTIEIKDEIEFDFDGEFKNDEGQWIPKPGMRAENYQIIVESGRFIENFLEQMVGMKAGEEKTLDLGFPENYHDEELKGKDARFKVKVHKIKRPNVPKLDDELAKKTNHETLKDLKDKVTEEISKQKVQVENNLVNEAILRELIDKTEFAISPSMVQRELDHDLANMKKQKNMSDEDFKAFVETIDRSLEEKTAEEKLKRGIIITTVIKEQKFEASTEDIQNELAKYNFPPDYDMSQMNMPAVVNQLNLDVLSNKAMAFIREQAKIDLNPVDPASLMMPGHGQTGHVHGPDCSH
jgi:trigger factor